jgi:hypothetical protein
MSTERGNLKHIKNVKNTVAIPQLKPSNLNLQQQHLIYKANTSQTTPPFNVLAL